MKITTTLIGLFFALWITDCQAATISNITATSINGTVAMVNVFVVSTNWDTYFVKLIYTTNSIHRLTHVRPKNGTNLVDYTGHIGGVHSLDAPYGNWDTNREVNILRILFHVSSPMQSVGTNSLDFIIGGLTTNSSYTFIPKISYDGTNWIFPSNHHIYAVIN
jgi:hypothetical protein